MRATVLILATVAVAAAKPPYARIVGGSVTNIANWPMATVLLFSSTGAAPFLQHCGGSILTPRTILSAAHCQFGHAAQSWRIRVGSTRASSGGVLHNTARIIIHPNYNPHTIDSDISILHSASGISFNNNARAGAIAGAYHNLPDNSVVWAIGWGATSYRGRHSENLRQVQIWTVNQATCRSRYASRGHAITDNMLCSGWLDVGGRDQCQGDSGGPLLHNNVIVGVSSFGHQCALARYPGVNVRVSRFTNWIRSNA